jgi:hypothetical protein
VEKFVYYFLFMILLNIYIYIHTIDYITYFPQEHDKFIPDGFFFFFCSAVNISVSLGLRLRTGVSVHLAKSSPAIRL